MKVYKFFVNHGAVNPVEGMVMTGRQFWGHLQFLVDEKGWSIREEDDGSVRLAEPRRRARFDFCPITAVYFDKTAKFLLTTQVETAAERLKIGPRVMARIVKLVDEEDSYPHARPAWLKRLGL